MFVAHTFGHKKVYFTTGSTKDIATFQETIQQLARHISTILGWKHGEVLGKAISNLKNPVFDLPNQLV